MRSISNYETMADVFNIIATICWVLIVFISLPVNVLCLFVLCKVRDIEDTTKLFLKSLTVADIMFCLFRGIPAIGAAVGNSWPFGDTACIIINILTYTFAYSAMFSLFAVNIDRCIAIVYPLRYSSLININKAWISVVLSWSISFISIISLAIISNWRASYYLYAHICRFDVFRNQTSYESYAIYTSSAVWYWLPGAVLFLIIICFISVMATSVSLRYKGRNGRIRNNLQFFNTRSTTTFFLMTLSQVAVNIPWIVNLFINEHKYLKTFSFMMYGSSGIWNVIVYYFRNRAFKYEINRLIFHLRFQGTVDIVR